MLLSLRGWGKAEFEWASPEFLQGARHALFAERVSPLLNEAEGVMRMELPSEPHAKLELARRKIDVERLIPTLRAVLFPKDDGDG